MFNVGTSEPAWLAVAAETPLRPTMFVARGAGVAVPAALVIGTSVVGTIVAYVREWRGLRYIPRRADVGPTVEFLYDKECPNAPEARASLERAFAAVGLRPSWIERELSSPDTPPQARVWGSPTVLVNGRDVRVMNQVARQAAASMGQQAGEAERHPRR